MWGNSFAIGQYIPLNSPIHRLDPRVKIVFVGISIINLFILQDWLSFLLWGGVILLLAFLSHLSFGYLLKSLRPLLFLLILTLVLHFFLLLENISGNMAFYTFPGRGYLKVF